VRQSDVETPIDFRGRTVAGSTRYQSSNLPSSLTSGFPGARVRRDPNAAHFRGRFQFAALGVSETVVRRILHEEGLLLERASQEPARAHPPRRFERDA